MSSGESDASRPASACGHGDRKDEGGQTGNKPDHVVSRKVATVIPSKPATCRSSQGQGSTTGSMNASQAIIIDEGKK